jgi:AcrR family transcriptional regulator
MDVLVKKRDEHDPRELLIEAAIRLFAERGYAGTSVRQLAEATSLNIAAVNYYFGGKQELYAAALRRAFMPVRDALPSTAGILEEARANGAGSAEEGVRRFIREFMLSLLPTSDGAAHARLLAREMTDPTPAFERIVREFVLPRNQVLVDLLKLSRPDLDDERLQLLASSIFGQCVFYQMAQPVSLRVLRRKRVTPDLVTMLAAHIATFSLAALRDYRV